MSSTLEPVIKMDERLRDIRSGSASYTQRLLVRDATIEQVQVIQGNNPTGILYIQDEISALFRKFNQKSSRDRSYLLEAFNGNSSYCVDRVTRKGIFIEKNTLSLIGTIQPDVLRSVFLSDESANDGFMQRLQLAVWPDLDPQEYVDAAPDLEAAKKAIDMLGGLYEEYERTLCFCDDAQPIFEGWFKRSMSIVHELNNEGQNNLANHVTKYQKLVPALSLLIELAENRHSKYVSSDSILKSIDWVNYLVTHAKRIYGIQDQVAVFAQSIFDKKDRLGNTFSPSEVVQNNWKGLTKTQDVRLGIDLLVKHNYLIKVAWISGTKGGRPSQRYRWNHAFDQ